MIIPRGSLVGLVSSQPVLPLSSELDPAADNLRDVRIQADIHPLPDARKTSDTLANPVSKCSAVAVMVTVEEVVVDETGAVVKTGSIGTLL